MPRTSEAPKAIPAAIANPPARRAASIARPSRAPRIARIMLMVSMADAKAQESPTTKVPTESSPICSELRIVATQAR
ncbi:MAG: hypothetical protein EBX81_02915 [bacterium]|nr:hypothetical protein [Candidatus Aquidulcis sp.]